MSIDQHLTDESHCDHPDHRADTPPEWLERWDGHPSASFGVYCCSSCGGPMEHIGTTHEDAKEALVYKCASGQHGGSVVSDVKTGALLEVVGFVDYDSPSPSERYSEW